MVATDIWFTLYVASVKHTLLSPSCTSLENREQSENLCINYFNLPKLDKITIILDLPKFSTLAIITDMFKVHKLAITFDLLKVAKMTSLGIFLSLVMVALQTSNLRNSYTSLKHIDMVLHQTSSDVII